MNLNFSKFVSIFAFGLSLTQSACLDGRGRNAVLNNTPPPDAGSLQPMTADQKRAEELLSRAEPLMNGSGFMYAHELVQDAVAADPARLVPKAKFLPHGWRKSPQQMEEC